MADCCKDESIAAGKALKIRNRWGMQVLSAESSAEIMQNDCDAGITVGYIGPPSSGDWRYTRAGTKDPCIAAKYWRDEAARLEDIYDTKNAIFKRARDAYEACLKHCEELNK